jgi:hypothetical protein
MEELSVFKERLSISKFIAEKGVELALKQDMRHLVPPVD